MGLLRNILVILILLIVVWATFLLVSYIISVMIFYTLEFPENVVIGATRVIIGFFIAGAWILGWYKLTRFWLYGILLSRKRET